MYSVIPFVKKEHIDLLDAPISYIAGIHADLWAEIPVDLKTRLEHFVEKDSI